MAGYDRMSQIDVTFKLMGAIREDRQTKSYVAFCPPLRLYSAGKSRPEAKAALTAAIETYLRLCYERGILGKLLKGRGFEPALAGSSADRPGNEQYINIAERQSEYDDTFAVEVPMHLIAQVQAEEPLACLQ